MSNQGDREKHVVLPVPWLTNPWLPGSCYHRLAPEQLFGYNNSSYMIKEIHAKTILNPVKQPDTWFGLKYNMNLYRGCQHRCIYCDSRSLCYGIDGFDTEVLVKVNAVDLLREALPRKRVIGTIGTGSMNDPYMPVEKHFNLAGRALEVIAENHFPVHVITKSDLVLKDIDTLVEINKVYAAVSFTVTAADNELCKLVEPLSPRSSQRFAAMRKLADQGICTGAVLMPVLPFIEDNEKNLTAIVEKAVGSGASYIIPSLGMTLRDRQRSYYYDKLDEHFPGLRKQYVKAFGGNYFASANQAKHLYRCLEELAYRYKIPLQIPLFEPVKAGEHEQPRLL
jgi:DNA repair photolyase